MPYKVTPGTHVGVGVGVPAVALAVGVGVNVAVTVGVGVNVAVDVGVKVAVAVAVGVNVAVGVGLGVGVTAGQAPGWETTTLSILQPSTPVLVSLPMRQRRTTLCPAAAAGRFTVVVMKPVEFPLHAGRPARGLLKPVLIVPV